MADIIPGTSEVQTNFGLPADMQAQIELALQRRQMAQLMQQQAMQPNIPQQTGPVTPRMSPLQPLLQALGGYFANKNVTQATQDIANVRKQYQEDTSREIAGLQGLPPDEAINAAQRSKNQLVQALGEKLRAQREARLKEYTTGAFQVDPAKAREALVTGQIPGAFGPAPEPVVTNVPTPGGSVNMVTNTGPYGRKTGTLQQGTTINLPGSEGKDLMAQKIKELGTWQERAQLAKGVLDANQSAQDALEAGAKAGGGEAAKQFLRKGLQAFGETAPDTAPVEQLQMALGQQILANARKLAPVTKEDIAQLQGILGSINTDPSALRKMLATTSAIATRDIQNFGDYVDEAQRTASSPAIRDLYSGQRIGYGLPPALPGKGLEGARVLQELQKRGGDITQFDLGGPVPANARFQLGGGAAAPIKAKSAISQKPISEMTDQEKAAEIDALKKQLGIK